MPTEDEIAWLQRAAQLEADGFPSVIGRAPRGWRNVDRPGYFGKRRDTITAGYDSTYGTGNWRLVWVAPGYLPGANARTTGVAARAPDVALEFADACKVFYEESYVRYLQDRPDDLDFICEFAECIDNSPTNVHSGLDYTAQEASSTHIQDIAVRNVLAKLGRQFTGKRTELLIIRSADSNGFRFGPGNVPFYRPEMITQPSRCPQWARKGSTEEFWQSNKWLQVRA